MEKSVNLREIKSLLEKFTNAHGISGSESDIRELLEKEIEPYVDTIRKDCMGNLIAVKKGEGPSIMLAAHMDEIGLMVRYIDDNGFLRFVGIGGWFDEQENEIQTGRNSRRFVGIDEALNDWGCCCCCCCC